MTDTFSPVTAQDDVRVEPCKICEEGTAMLEWELRPVEYGRADQSQVRADILLPVWSCEKCGMSYLGEEAELLQHDAICEALGRLRPRDIVAIRKAAGLNQPDFAAELEVGVASLKRWESAATIQDKRNDRLIRGFALAASRPLTEPIFRFPVTDSSRTRAARFKLRLECAQPTSRIAVAA
jgi:DNA-binding transcriptional regulator YiaG